MRRRVLWSGGAAARTQEGVRIRRLACQIPAVYRLIQTDAFWHRITSGSDDSDGIVQGVSQIYPGALLNVRAEDPTSHTGETRTERSYNEVERVLAQYLGVQERQ